MHGKNYIGFSLSVQGGDSIFSVNPATREMLMPYYAALPEEIEMAVKKASSAFEVYKNFTGEEKAIFLETIAGEINDLGDLLVKTVMDETALPEPRVRGEMNRTMGQLKLFAQYIREGSWVDASIDTADPARTPVPKPDVRKMLKPTGPVVVFAASNFPLAFSTAGGDTASALAAGNPVIMKAHSSHLGTNELVSDAIIRAAKKTKMPDGVFSSLIGSGKTLGQALVKHPLVKSVGFTGSYAGGMTLCKLAALRETPIPVFAEMGSLNPIIVLPAKVRESGSVLAATIAGAITLGVGQFCTKPGLLFAINEPGLDEFIKSLATEIKSVTPSTMLNEGIWKGYCSNKKEIEIQAGVETETLEKNTNGEWKAVASVVSVSGEKFLANPKLQEEVFGPFSLIVKCRDKAELKKVIESMKGQLTATVMGNIDELEQYKDIILLAQEIAGRVIINGVPTGVEVCHSMIHGGPYPATSDSRFTSVGTEAIRRFARPLCFQNYPQELLPPELKNDNPLKILRLVNGTYTHNAI